MMLRFEAKQKAFKIHNTWIGGEMGERPTVLVGSIFQKKHFIVKDASKGTFDAKKARELLQVEEECSLMTGNPRMIDIVAETIEAMTRYISFIVEHCDVPFFVDSPLARVRLAAMRFCAENKIMDRAIYNTIEPHGTPEELDQLKDLKVKSAVLMGCSSQHVKPKDRLTLIGGSSSEKGLIGLALDSGVENILVDAGVLDLPSSSWTAQAIMDIKNETGYPAGCAPSNALYTWLRNKKLGSPEMEACGGGVLSLPVFAGSDFIFYGPIQHARWVFPAIALVDAMLAYGAKLNRVKPASREHPLYKFISKS